MLIFYIICVFLCLMLLYIAGEGKMEIAEASAAICVSFMPVLNFGAILCVLVVWMEQMLFDREMAKPSGINSIKEK